MSAMEDKIAEGEDLYLNTQGNHGASASASSLPARHYTSVNTGPKGVLQDYKMAKEREERRMKEQTERDLDAIKKGSMTVSTVQEDEKKKLSDKIATLSDDELDALVADIDEKFAVEYATLRMKELELTDTRMKTGVAMKEVTGPSKSSKKQFGDLHELSRTELVDFVESEDPSVLIFIHIYQPNLRACVRLSEIMATLAKMFPHIKWARMCEDEKRDFDDDTLPILVAYRGGDVVQSHIRLVDDIGHNFDLDDIIDFLESHKYLKASEAIIHDN